jgi:hypothetical protein
VLRKAFAAVWSRVAGDYFYRPEKHYMRGPGPKSLSMIGRRLRNETRSVTLEPLPESWLILIHSLAQQEQKRPETEPQEERSPERAVGR